MSKTPNKTQSKILTKSDRALLVFATIGGVALVGIGARFFLWPEAAAKFFGVAARPTGTELHTAVALRDVWLGLLALAFVVLRDWRALVIWFALGALVCFGDAALVWQATAKSHAIAFHTISGISCAAIATACWRRLARA